MGSWTTAVAAKQLSRNFIGAEISEKYCEIGRQRLRQQILI
jgi:DNA modification methylase